MQGEGVEEVLYEESGKVVGSEVRWRRGRGRGEERSDECMPLETGRRRRLLTKSDFLFLGGATGCFG